MRCPFACPVGWSTGPEFALVGQAERSVRVTTVCRDGGIS